MLTRELVNNTIKAFTSNDREAIVNSFTENGRLEILGFKMLVGREAIRAFFFEQNSVQAVEYTQHHLIIDGNSAIADGEGKCIGGDGKVFENWVCDVYDFEGDKVSRLRSFVIDKK